MEFIYPALLIDFAAIGVYMVFLVIQKFGYLCALDGRTRSPLGPGIWPAVVRG